uniref:CBS domain-containing protein n=1 Tax=Thermofilum pendens TaxID=2269 RepID=A0A7C3WUI4_THEPE
MVSSDGRSIEGVVSERDIVRALASGADPATPVGEVMRRRVVAVDATTPYHDALKLLAKERIRHLVILKGSELAGVARAASVATTSVVTIPADALLSTAAELMSANRIRHLVVTEGGKVVSVISLRDLVSTLKE